MLASYRSSRLVSSTLARQSSIVCCVAWTPEKRVVTQGNMETKYGRIV